MHGYILHVWTSSALMSGCIGERVSIKSIYCAFICDLGRWRSLRQTPCKCIFCMRIWVMSGQIVYWRAWPLQLATFLSVSVVTHVTARDIPITRQTNCKIMQHSWHESTPDVPACSVKELTLSFSEAILLLVWCCVLFCLGHWWLRFLYKRLIMRTL